jgi:hypothetical protein
VVAEVEVARAVDDDARRVRELGLGSGEVVAGEAVRTVAGDGGDEAVRVDLPDPVVSGIGDVQVAVPVDRDILWMRQLGMDWPGGCRQTGPRSRSQRPCL